MHPNLITPVDRPLGRLFRYCRRYQTTLNLSIFWSFMNKLLDLAPPVLVAWAIDTVVRQPPPIVSMVAANDPLQQGLWLGALAVLIFGFESLFEWLYTLGFSGLAQQVQHDLRVDAYGHMQTREMAFFEHHRVGETMSMLSDDINQLERFLNTVFNDLVQLVSLAVISAAILLASSPFLTLVAVIPIPIVVGFALWFQRLLAPRYQAVRRSVGRLNTRLENNLAGIPVIKAFTAEALEAERLRQTSADYRDRNLAAIRLSAMFVPLIRMGVALGFGMVLVLGTVMTLNGEISPGTFTLFGMMCQRILWPLTNLGKILDETERCRASAARIFGLLDTPSTITNPGRPQPLPRSQGHLQFRDVHFAYPGSGAILNGLDFTIRPGETVGLAGATGAGKSTLIKMILRFYDPGSGSVLLDGHDLRTLDLSELRRAVALVSQDVYLFHGTIAENIAYGVPGATAGQIEAAAVQAHFHDFVRSLPDGYGTVVGERGIRLSGGQRQRLSIARALLKDAPLLVLDEATSSVDTETEREIQKHLLEYTRGRSALVVAHRLSTIRGADRILVLNQGQLVEEGHHDDLVARGGTYADLWSLQSGLEGLQA